MQGQRTIFANFEMLLTTIIWGSSYIVIKKSLPGINAITFIYYRFTLAALATAIILIFLRKNPLQHLKNGMVLGTLLFFICVTQTLALRKVSATNSSFITCLFVIFVPILNFIIYGKKLQHKVIIALILVSFGLWNITGGINGFGYDELLALISALTFALYVLYVGSTVKKCDIWILNFQQFFFISILSLITMLFFKLSFVITTPYSIFGIIYLSLFASVLACVTQFRGQKHILPVVCAIILSSEPVFATIFANFFGQETLTIKNIFGGILIIMAVLFVQFWDKKANNNINTS